MEQSFPVSNSADQEKITQRRSKQENNQKPILKFFLLKSMHVFLLPLLKSAASHTSSICLGATPFLQLVLMLQRELATSSHPSIIFLEKKKTNSPSYKMTAGHTEYRATWKLQFLPTWIAQLRLFELSLRVYKPRFVGFSG